MQNNHMENRCYFIFIMCSLSLYNWYNYSLYGPFNNNILMPYYQNCLLMIFYLCWDIFKMITNKILYRTDLMIHHIITLIIFLSCINYISLQLSNMLIMECISLMNYILRKHPNILKIYRTLCIILIRIPLILWSWLFYNPSIVYPYLKIVCSHYHYLYLITQLNILFFFIVYDFFILYKLWGEKVNI
jgi:hypothetical protein